MNLKNVFLYIFLLLTATFEAGAGRSELPFPAVPDSLRTPQQRSAYLMAHYFDRLGEVPAEVLADDEWFERNFASFLTMPFYAAQDAETSARNAFAELLKHVDIHRLDALAEDYLHSPDSPAYNEDLYIAWLETARSNSPDDLRRDIFAHKAEVARRNLPGTPATDFEFEPLPGRNATATRLSEIPGEKLLVFFDPDCTSCRKVLKQIAGRDDIARAVAEGLLTVIAIYHDAEPEHLAEAAGLVLDEWIGGSEDGTVSGDELYELILAPTVYRIGADGKVLQRNPTIKELAVPQ